MLSAKYHFLVIGMSRLGIESRFPGPSANIQIVDTQYFKWPDQG